MASQMEDRRGCFGRRDYVSIRWHCRCATVKKKKKKKKTSRKKKKKEREREEEAAERQQYTGRDAKEHS